MRQTKDVRGSTQPWGYVHQSVSHAWDIYFIKKLQSATDCCLRFPMILTGSHLGDTPLELNLSRL